MDPLVVVTTFGAIFLAELPDKTMVASMILSSRYHRPWAVWAGASTAFVLQVVLAVIAGGLLAQVPTRVVQFVTAGLFAVGALILLREGAEIDEPGADAGTPDDPPADDDSTGHGDRPRAAANALTARGVALRAFGVVFVAEFGDLTQLATASLAARSGEPFAVLLGASLALCSVAAIAVVAGRAVLRVLPVVWVRRVAATIFGVLALVTFVEALRG